MRDQRSIYVTSETAPRCWESHPIIQLGGGTVRGGSCFNPPKDMDIYVGFDSGMKRHERYPWAMNDEVPIDICIPIQDGRIPTDVGKFKRLIQYLREQLAEGKKIAIGCMGGHGRTGLGLAALYKEVTGDMNAIKWVRENYCEKAVETKEQVDFLVKEFGIIPMRGYKDVPEKPKSIFTPTAPGGTLGTMSVRPDPGDKVLRVWGGNVVVRPL